MKHFQQPHQNNPNSLASIKPSLFRAWLFLASHTLLRRVSIASLALVVVFSFAIGLSVNTSAAVKYSGLTIPEKASAYESGLILERCLVNLWVEVNEPYVKQGRVAQSPNAGDKWTVWDKPIINYHQTLKSDDNVMDCAEYDNALIKGAIKRLGIDPVHFVCEMGGKRANGTSAANCEKGTGNFAYQFPDGKITREKLVKYLKDQVGLNLDSPGNETRYWRSYNIVANYCVGASISKAEWDKEGGNSRYNYKDPKTGKDVYFLASSLKNERPKYKDNQQGDVNCRTYWDRMDTYYPDYARYIANLGDEERKKEDAAREDSQAPVANTDEGTSSCRVEGIGWILCPVINAMAGMADASFGLVAAFMKVEPLGFATDNPLYVAWSLMRNVANVAFVIAFLVIIFSQLTGAGVSNYGVKKMLPRLVIAALLVNVSYFICALAVDASNILGVSAQQLLTGMADSINAKGNTEAEEWGSIATSILSLGAIGGLGVIGVTVFSSVSIWAMLAGLLPLLVTALFALIIAFLVLLARQAFIIILIVISPLAFVAFLLPNTEDLFKKWRSFFITLLALFPMMALVFGGSILASSIMRAGAINNMGSDDAAVATTGFFIYLGSVAVLAIPFFITPLLIKLSSGVLNRFAGFVNNRNRGPFDSMRKRAEQIRDNSRNRSYATKLRGGKVTGIGARRKARLDTISSSLSSEANHAQTGYVSRAIQDNSAFANAAAGGKNAGIDSITRVTASAISTADKLDAEEVSATGIVLKEAQLDMKETRELALGKSVTGITSGKTFSAAGNLAMQKAAIQQMVASNDVDGMNEAWNDSKIRNNNELRSSFADALQGSSGRPTYFSQGMIAGLRQDPNAVDSEGKSIAAPANFKSVIEAAIAAKAYSPEKIATADKDDLAAVIDVMKTSTNLSDAQKNIIRDNAKIALNDDKLGKIIGKNMDRVIELSSQDRAPVEGTLNIQRDAPNGNTATFSTNSAGVTTPVNNDQPKPPTPPQTPPPTA